MRAKALRLYRRLISNASPHWRARWRIRSEAPSLLPVGWRWNDRRFFHRAPLAAVAALGLGSLGSGLRPGVVMGNSMSPTLRSGQWFVLDAAAYRRSAPERRDIVVFYHGGVTYIKRVVGIAGDTIRLLETHDEDGVWVCPVEPGMLGRARRLCRRSRRWRLQELRVPGGHVYVVGDMVAGSVDSRHLGPIPLGEIRGRVCLTRPDPPYRPIPHRPFRTASGQQHCDGTAAT